MKSLMWILVLILDCGSPIVAYKILGIFPAFIKSHSIIGGSLMEGLANAGHNVTFITPFPKRRALLNLRYISLSNELEMVIKNVPSFKDFSNDNLWKRHYNIFETAKWTSNFTLASSPIRRFLNDPNESFDVIIATILWNEAILGIGHHFKAPVISFSTLHTSLWTNELTGNLSPYSYVPHIFLPFTDKMSFYERIYNAAFQIYEFTLFKWKHIPHQTDIYNEHFPDPKPPLDVLCRNVSLVLLNTHHTIHFPIPYTPNMIEIGGINVNRKDESLPLEVKQLLDGAANNKAIYFSLGTNVKLADMDPQMINDILDMLGSLNQIIFWKIDVDNMPNKPNNVYVSNWFPQNAILKHTNTKIFISHGGLLSLTEAVYHGVPVVAIPFIVDQQVNVKSAVDKGYCICIALPRFNAQSLYEAIHLMLTDNTYSLRAKEISARFRDQPMSPLETAIYWTEYIIRHQGAPHLRSAGLDLSWWQYLCLDVFGFLLLLHFLLLCFSVVVYKLIFKFFTKFCRKIKFKIN